MGYGGALLWTGLTRNLKAHHPNKKIILVQPKSLRQVLARKPYTNRVVYQHNPDIDVLTDAVRWRWQRLWFRPDEVIVVRMDDPRYHYWTYQDANRIEYVTGRHAIQVACDVHGIRQPVLRPRLELSGEEEAHVTRLLTQAKLRPAQYICLEPHAKTSFTPNKAWFWNRWVQLAQRLKRKYPGIQLVQVGEGSQPVLTGVHDLTGRTTFRETGAVLKQALFLISCLGGLVHLNKAVGGRAVVLVSAWEPLELASYPDDINLYRNIDCQCRGLKKPCPLGRKSMKLITVDDVLAASHELLRTVSL